MAQSFLSGFIKKAAVSNQIKANPNILKAVKICQEHAPKVPEGDVPGMLPKIEKTWVEKVFNQPGLNQGIGFWSIPKWRGSCTDEEIHQRRKNTMIKQQRFLTKLLTYVYYDKEKYTENPYLKHINDLENGYLNDVGFVARTKRRHEQDLANTDLIQVQESIKLSKELLNQYREFNNFGKHKYDFEAWNEPWRDLAYRKVFFGVVVLVGVGVLTFKAITRYGDKHWERPRTLSPEWKAAEEEFMNGAADAYALRNHKRGEQDMHIGNVDPPFEPSWEAHHSFSTPEDHLKLRLQRKLSEKKEEEDDEE